MDERLDQNEDNRYRTSTPVQVFMSRAQKLDQETLNTKRRRRLRTLSTYGQKMLRAEDDLFVQESPDLKLIYKGSILIK